MHCPLFPHVALAGIAALLMLAAGCTTEPITGRSRFLLTSAGDESSLGLQAWNDVLRKEPVSANRAHLDAVTRVGRNLAAAVNEPGFQWEFRVLASAEANAFCLPGGKVAVYEGLFKYVANDAELAAVLGHEIAHAVARHGGERMTQAMGVDLGSQITDAYLAQKGVSATGREQWLLAYSGITTVGVILPYSRTHEYSADQIGLVYMARAGYDPRAAVTFWRKFGKGGKNLEILSTHPLDDKRLARLSQLLPKTEADYAAAPVKHGLGNPL